MGRQQARYDSLYSRQPTAPIQLHHLGLLNLGNSCFYNSILQSLSVCRPLEAIIADPPATSPSLLAASPASPSFSHEPTLSPIPITLAFLDLLARLSPEVPVNNSKALNPKALLKELCQKHEEYADASQQDAHELLLHLLDGVQMEEIDLIKKISPPRLKLTKQQRRMTVRKEDSATIASTPVDAAPIVMEEEVITESSDSDSSSDDDTEDESRIHVNANANGTTESGEEVDAKGKQKMRPFVDTTFGGKLAGFIVCDTCQAVSLTHEDFLDISLSLKDDEGNRSRRRDRIRKTFGGGLFSSKKSASGNSPVRAVSSLSEAEAEASTESELDDHTDSERSGHSSNLFRRKSLDPAALNDARRPFWSTKSASREPSPSSSVRQSSSLSRATGATAKPKIPKPTAEQSAYNRKVLAEVPGPVPGALPPQLRWSIPGVPSTAPSSSSASSVAPPAPPVRSLSNLSIQDRNVDQTSTDLYECFRQFTAVEILADSNAFACRNCWKLLNPGLVEKRRAEKRRRRGVKRGDRKQNVVVDSTLLPPPPPLSSQPSLSSVGGSVETSTGNVTDDEATEATPSIRDYDADGGEEEDIDSSAESRRSSAVKLPLTIANVLALTPPTPPLSPSEKSANPSSSIATTSKLSAPTNGSVSFSSTRPSFSSLPPPHPTAIRPPPRAARHILRSAQKRFLISANALPPVLVVHFKRFRSTTKSSMFGTAFMNLKKRDDDLTFPERLDLTPFLAPVQRAPPKSGSRSRRIEPENETETNSNGLKERAGYRLVSVIVHVGTLAMGHYISYCLSSKYSEILSARGSGGLNQEEPEQDEDETQKGATVPKARRWVYCSDDEVRVCETEEVLKSKAYILFYEKIVH